MKINRAKNKDNNIEKEDMVNSCPSLSAEKISDKIKAKKKDLKFDKKNELFLFEIPTNLQKIAFPLVAQVESASRK